MVGRIPQLATTAAVLSHVREKDTMQERASDTLCYHRNRVNGNGISETPSYACPSTQALKRTCHRTLPHHHRLRAGAVASS